MTQVNTVGLTTTTTTQALKCLRVNKMPHLCLFHENNGTYVVLNRTYNADFQIEFKTQEEAQKFITEFMFKFFTDRVN
jgi:hypothetical protein